MSESNASMGIPSNVVLDTLSSGFFTNIQDLFELNIAIEREEFCVKESFIPSGEAIGQIDFVGSVAGFVAVSANQDLFINSFGITKSDEEETQRQQVAVPLKEMLNTVAGKCLKILVKEYSIVTMLAPKVTFGHICYPKVKCFTKTLYTEYGVISFHLSVDQMKLDVSRLIDRLEESERKSQKVMEYLHMLFGNLEKTQTHIMTEVSLTVNNIKVIEEILAKSKGGSAEISSDLAEALNSVNNVKELVIRKLSDTIYDLKRFKNMLLNYMLINKKYSSKDHLEVLLAGTLTERCDLSFFEELEKGVLTVDTRSLLNFTQNGISRWVKSIAATGEDVDLQFVKCSAEFLKAKQEHQGFVRKGSIVSVSVNYFCQACHHREAVEVMVEEEKMGNNRMPTMKCGCGSELRTGELQKEIKAYFL